MSASADIVHAPLRLRNHTCAALVEMRRAKRCARIFHMVECVSQYMCRALSADSKAAKEAQCIVRRHWKCFSVFIESYMCRLCRNQERPRRRLDVIFSEGGGAGAWLCEASRMGIPSIERYSVCTLCTCRLRDQNYFFPGVCCGFPFLSRPRPTRPDPARPAISTTAAPL